MNTKKLDIKHTANKACGKHDAVESFHPPTHTHTHTHKRAHTHTHTHTHTYTYCCSELDRIYLKIFKNFEFYRIKKINQYYEIGAAF